MSTSDRPERHRTALAQGKRVTLKEVARRARVGTITASRALREPEKVSPSLRARILDAVETLGYIENRVASGLASGASRIVPIVLPTLAHPVYVPFLRGVHAELDQHGYQVLLATTEYLQEEEERLVSTLLGWFPAGLMLTGVDHLPNTEQRLKRAVRAGLHVIEFMDLTDAPIDLNVGLSHGAIGAAVADYFIDKGYRHIAYAGTMAKYDLRSLRRAEAFLKRIRSRGLPDQYDVRRDEPFSMSVGGRLLGDVLEAHPRVEAIFFANDDLAAGAVLEAQRRGIAIPGRLAIMGMNDLEIASALNPTISSVAVDQLGMGRLSARLLLDRLAGRKTEKTTSDVGFTIVERESTSARIDKRRKSRSAPRRS